MNVRKPWSDILVEAQKDVFRYVLEDEVLISGPLKVLLIRGSTIWEVVRTMLAKRDQHVVFPGSAF